MSAESINDFFGSIPADTTSGGLATAVRKAFPAESAVRIAERVGLNVVFGDWFPVTAGECDHSKATITVNRRAALDTELVVAHELGHHLLHKLAMRQDENFCDEFAYNLVGRRIES